MANAQIGGLTSYQFLNIPSNARVAALGGNLITVKDNDLNLGFQNPAMLNGSMHNQMTNSYVNYFGDINMGFHAYSRTFKNAGSFAAGIQYADYGKFIRADETGTQDGEFKAKDMALNIAGGRTLHDSIFTIGANLKTIYSAYDVYSSVALAADVGGAFHNKKKELVFTGLIKNAGLQLKPFNKGGTREALPFEVQLGMSKKLKHLPLRFSVIATNLQKWNIRYADPSNPESATDTITGAKKEKYARFLDNTGRHLIINGEFMITKNFHLRIGYNHLRRQELKTLSRTGISGFSFGLGFKVSKFMLSYGVAQYHLSGFSNVFSFSLNFSDLYKKSKLDASSK